MSADDVTVAMCCSYTAVFFTWTHEQVQRTRKRVLLFQCYVDYIKVTSIEINRILLWLLYRAALHCITIKLNNSPA